MKTFPKTQNGWLMLLGLMVGFASSSSQAQEENLDMALKMQERRVAGLTALAERIKSFGFLGKSQNVLNKLEDRERKEDPFGMAMDPEEELPEIVAEAGTEEVPEEAQVRTSLQEALQKFQPSGFFPSRGEIIVGAQNLGVGDEVVIDYKGVVFNLIIQKVSEEEIVMKDSDTGEEAGVHLGFANNLPEGMSRRRPTATDEDKSREAETIVPFSKRVVKVE
jgi:hypothetical protein